MAKRRGHVRWFNAAKGYGFVVEDGRDQDVYMHYTAIQIPGFRQVAEGQRIVFELTTGDRGPIAVDVVPVHANDDAS